MDFKQWVNKKNTEDEWYRTAGRLGAYESGAESRLKGKTIGRIYTRSDMEIAYIEGFSDMNKYLNDGNQIICSCCGQIVEEKEEDYEKYQE